MLHFLPIPKAKKPSNLFTFFGEPNWSLTNQTKQGRVSVSYHFLDFKKVQFIADSIMGEKSLIICTVLYLGKYTVRYGIKRRIAGIWTQFEISKTWPFFFGEVGKTRWALYLRKQFRDLSLLSFLAGVVFQQSLVRYSHVSFFVLLPFLVYKCGNLAVSHIASDDILSAATDGGYLRSGESLIATDENSFRRKRIRRAYTRHEKPQVWDFYCSTSLIFLSFRAFVTEKKTYSATLHLPNFAKKSTKKKWKSLFRKN